MGDRSVIHPVTRIEGHAKVILDKDDDGHVESGHLQVLEIRGFEKLLQGTELFKMPQITARLCGVCPAAHHLAAVVAIENGLGLTVPPTATSLRDLLYAGHILHSHALSNFVLTGPDILLGIGADADQKNIFALLDLDADLAKRLLRIRSIGQQVVEIVGGRGVHPITAVPGGMSAHPGSERMKVMAEMGAEATGLLEDIASTLEEKLSALADARTAANLDCHSLALSRDGQVDFLAGDVVVQDPQGAEERRFSGADYIEHLVEHVMPGSYMKSVRLKAMEELSYFVGPLARLNINESISTPRANERLQAFRALGVPRRSALDFVAARFLEMVHCAERINEIASSNLESSDLRVPAEPAGGRFVSLIEAPRGILVHDYHADENGRVQSVNFIVATQNNYDAIDQAVTGLARHYESQDDDQLLLNGVEFAVRCFDPCLACATHAAGQMPLEIVIRQNGKKTRTIRREARS